MARNIVTKRIIAFIIDFILILLVVNVPLILFFSSGDRSIDTNQFNIFTDIIILTIPVLKDSFKKRSIGKRILGLKIYNSQGKSLKYWQVLLRNIILWPILMVEIIVFLTSKDKRRLGDLLARTYVSST